MTRDRVRLFFDLDGTLTDPAEGIGRCLGHALERLGVSPAAADDPARFVGPPLREAFAALLGTADPALVERAVAAYRERFGSVGLLENRVYPGIPELLEELGRRGWELHVVTAKPTVYAERVLEHFELSRFFGRCFGSELSGERSRKDELVEHSLEVLGAGPRTWMVGDRGTDVTGALAHGLGAIGVLWGYGTREELLEAGPERLVSDPAELAAWAEAVRSAS